MILVDLSVAGVQGADAGERALADQVDQGAQPPAGERHVMGGEKQVQAIFRGVALVLAFRDTFEGVAHQLRVREAVGAVVLGDELHERRAVVIFLDALAFGLGLLLGEGLIRWFAAACNHTILDGHAARLAATDLLLLTHLLALARRTALFVVSSPDKSAQFWPAVAKRKAGWNGRAWTGRGSISHDALPHSIARCQTHTTGRLLSLAQTNTRCKSFFGEGLAELDQIEGGGAGAGIPHAPLEQFPVIGENVAVFPASGNRNVKLFAIDGGEGLGRGDQKNIVHRFALRGVGRDGVAHAMQAAAQVIAIDFRDVMDGGEHLGRLQSLPTGFGLAPGCS